MKNVEERRKSSQEVDRERKRNDLRELEEEKSHKRLKEAHQDEEDRRKRWEVDREVEKCKRQEDDDVRMAKILDAINKKAHDQILMDMETRISSKLDNYRVDHSAGKDYGDFATKLFNGLKDITQPAFVALGVAAAPRVPVATLEALTIPTHVPFDIMQHLQETRMDLWTTEHVQQWLDGKNLSELRAGATKQSLDGRGLKLIKDSSASDADAFVEEVWPIAFRLHKALFKQALKEL
jgi:hypothetical protein